MTRARRASRPRFRLLPTVLLTLAILGVPTVVYAWGRSSSSFDIAKVRVAGARLVPDKRALRLLQHDYSGRNLFTVTGGDVRKTLGPAALRLRRQRQPRLSQHPLRDHHRVRPGGLRPGRGPVVRHRRERLRHLHRGRCGRPALRVHEARRRSRVRRFGRRGERRFDHAVAVRFGGWDRGDAGLGRDRRCRPPLRRPGTPAPRRGVSSPARSRRRCRSLGSPSPAVSGRAPSSATRRPPRCCA